MTKCYDICFNVRFVLENEQKWRESIVVDRDFRIDAIFRQYTANFNIDIKNLRMTLKMRYIRMCM